MKKCYMWYLNIAGVGRYSNADYLTFLSVLTATQKSLTQQNKVRSNNLQSKNYYVVLKKAYTFIQICSLFSLIVETVSQI